MTNDIDRALDTATHRVRTAEEELRDEPIGTERSIELATEVERRAEDVDVLAHDGPERADRA